MKNMTCQATSAQEKLIVLLSQLMFACEQDAKRFDRASHEVTNDELALLFRRYARRRAEFAKELREHVSRIEGKPGVCDNFFRASRSSSSKIRTGRRDDGSILSDCEHAEKVLCKMYEEALQTDLPGELQMSLRRHALAVNDVYEQMRDLCAALAWCTVPMAV